MQPNLILTDSRQIKVCFEFLDLCMWIQHYKNLLRFFSDLRLWTSHVWSMSFMISSTYNLVMLTLERYVGIIHPIWHKVHIGK